ncbi:MAG: hypothetical protein ACRDNP_14820 [Gaiellaceae bacterium]
MSSVHRRLGVVLLAAAVVVTTIGFDAARGHNRPGAHWRVAEAESISTVRGLRVRARECRGLGKGVTVGGRRRFRHFSCVAGARASWQTYDSVAVLYVLHALGPYVGPRSRPTLTDVRFIGGPAIP